MLVLTFRNKLYDFDTMKEFHIISRDDVIDIFKKVLNDDVAKHISSYIAHPIHEFIGELMLYNPLLNLTWSSSGYKLANDFIKQFGYSAYEKMRRRNIMIINNVGNFSGLGRPYLPVNMESRKIDISGEASQNGIKTSMSWTKKKMIQNYYKSIV